MTSKIVVNNIEADAGISTVAFNDQIRVGSATTIHSTGIDLGSGNINSHNINSSGIVTAIGLDINGNGDISGNLNVAGVLTYEDVTSVDAVGLSTFQAGIHVTGGSVGIGTAVPNEELHIHASGTSYIRFTDETSGTGATDGAVFGLDHPHLYAWNYEAGDFVVATNATEKLRIHSDGEVECKGGGVGQNALLVTGNYSSGNNVDIQTWQRTGGAVQAKIGYKDADTSMFFGTDTAHSLAIMTGGTEKLRINSDGTIRLKSDGTAANKARFEINEKWNNNATDFGIDFKRTYDVGGDDQDAGFIHVKRNGGSSQIGMSFGIGNKDDVSEKLLLTSNGDVGIGTAVPITAADYSSLSLVDTSGAQIEFKRTSNDTTHYIWTDGSDSLNIGANYNGDGTSGESGDLVFKVNGNNERLRINNSGYMTTAPSGMMIRSGFYDTGHGTGATTTVSNSTWTTININGTNQKLHNITKFSTDGLAYNKVSSNSHLNVTINFPFYYDDADAGNGGFGVRCLFSTDDGANYHNLSDFAQGPCDGWGAGAYGGTAAGVFTYTWNSRMNGTQASTVLAKTGNIRFYWQTRIWSGTSNLHMIGYTGYSKKGSIIIQEIAE